MLIYWKGQVGKMAALLSTYAGLSHLITRDNWQDQTRPLVRIWKKQHDVVVNSSAATAELPGKRVAPSPILRPNVLASSQGEGFTILGKCLQVPRRS